MVLPAGSLIQVGEKSKIKYSFRIPKKTGWAGEDGIIEILEPMNFILDFEVLRKVKLSNLFVTRIPVNQDFEYKKDIEDYFPSIRNAWDRLALFVSRDESTKDYVDDLYKRAKEEPLKVGVKAGKINLLYPGHGDSEFVKQYPTEFEIIWDAPRKYSGPFDVYIWKSKEARPSPIGRTSGNKYVASASQPGSYFVQVGTVDNRAWSKAKIFHLSEPMKIPKNDWGPFVLDAISPPEGLISVATKRRQVIEFKWDYQRHLNIESLHLHLKKAGQKKPTVVELDASSLSVKRFLSPGRYTWNFVVKFSAILGNNGVMRKTLETPERRLSLVKGHEDRAIAIFEKLLSRPNKPKWATTVFFDGNDF
jgi:hypothetical protein